jgi:putative N6-adenine-specific DNA methylase
MEDNFKMVYQNLFFGFEEILTRVYHGMLGAQNVETGVRMVSFKGDGFMYKTNLALRTALRS